MISEIRVVTESVADLDRALRFYRDGLGYEERARGPVPAELGAPWRMPAGLRGEIVHLAAPGSGTGMLRLVRFDSPGETLWGDYSRRQDAAHYAVNYRTRDAHETLARLAALGATAAPWQEGPVEPHHWFYGEVEVLDSMFQDPDGALVDVYQILAGAPQLGELAGEVSPVETMAIHTLDAPRSRDFYVGLGFGIFHEAMVEPQEFLGMPPGSQMHNVNMMFGGDVVPGRIELAQRIGEGEGVSLGDRAVPPSLGYLSISFESDALEDDLARARELGATPVAGPVDADVPGLGRVRLATVLGPDREALELYER